MTSFIGSIDQGTTSTRFIVFDRSGSIVALAQKEHAQIYPQPGWVEHSPAEIARNTDEVIAAALHGAKLSARDLVAVGITNQRETTLLWDRRSGEPLHNALVWQDTRVDPLVAYYAAEGGKDRFRGSTGLPLASYFSGLKLRWLLDNVPGARKRAAAGELMFGTMDSWVLWNLTGGRTGGLHITDVTNASRTQLMRLDTLAWDEGILSTFTIPSSLLPRIASSSEIYGEITVGPLAGVPIAGILGDQQAALVGQTCFEPGEAKNTYGRCLPGQIELISPLNGQTLSGVVEVRGTADLPNFGFYKFEMKLPDQPNWLTIQAGNVPVQAGKLGDWDTRRLSPGEYQLGLVVVDNQARLSPPCIVQVRVIPAPEITSNP